MAMRFHDKVCLVTGGGSGIGLATCRRMAREGGRVVVIDVNSDHGQSAAADINGSGGSAIFSRTDVSKSSDVRTAVDAALSKWQAIDVIVNNAAMMSFDPVVGLDEETWKQVLAVNLDSVFYLCKYALPHMREHGAVVNISSVHAHESEAGVAPYAASKAAIESFSRVLALECESKKIRVNCVAPGAVNTPMLWNNPNVKAGIEKIEGAVGEPDDIAAAICFLASNEARFITGATLVVDGGRLDIL